MVYSTLINSPAAAASRSVSGLPIMKMHVRNYGVCPRSCPLLVHLKGDFFSFFTFRDYHCHQQEHGEDGEEVLHHEVLIVLLRERSE